AESGPGAGGARAAVRADRADATDSDRGLTGPATDEGAQNQGVVVVVFTDGHALAGLTVDGGEPVLGAERAEQTWGFRGLVDHGSAVLRSPIVVVRRFARRRSLGSERPLGDRDWLCLHRGARGCAGRGEQKQRNS